MDRIINKKSGYFKLVAIICVVGLLCPYTALAGSDPYGVKNQNKPPLIPLNKYEKAKEMEKEAIENKLTIEPEVPPSDERGQNSENKPGDDNNKQAGPIIISSEDYEALKELKASREIEILPDKYKDINSENYEKIKFAYLVNKDGILIGMKISGSGLTIYLDCRGANNDGLSGIITDFVMKMQIMEEAKKNTGNKGSDATTHPASSKYSGTSPLPAESKYDSPNHLNSDKKEDDSDSDKLVVGLGVSPKKEDLSEADIMDNHLSDGSEKDREPTLDTEAVKKDISKMLKTQEQAVEKFYDDAAPYYSKLESVLKTTHWMWEKQGIDPQLYYAGLDGIMDAKEARRMVEESIRYLYANTPGDITSQAQRGDILNLEERLRVEYVEPALELYKREIKKASIAFYKSVEELIRPITKPLLNKTNGATEVIISLPKETLE